MTWTVQDTTGLMKVAHDDNGKIEINKSAQVALLAANVGLYDNVSYPPVVYYESRGEGDSTAAYLNALLYIPDAEVIGMPPYELVYDDVIATEPDDKADDVPEEKALPASYRRPRKPGDDFHTGGMVALLPDADSAAKLAIPGGDPADELHVTLFFMSDAIMASETQRDILRAFVNYTIGNYGWHDTITASVNGAGVLGDEDAKVYLVGDSFELKMFYEQIQRMFDQLAPGIFPVYNSQREPWIAHLTAGYGDAVNTNKLTYRGSITFDRVRLAIGDTYTDFDIRGGNQLAEDTLEYLARHEDAPVMETDKMPSLKSLSNKDEDDMPGRIKLAALNITDAELAEDAYEAITNPDYKGRGNAATLSRYWTRGEGAPKIVWGRPGDFKMCVSKLRKYVRDPEGLCATYHHRATGEWPGPKAHGGKGLGIPVAPDSVMGHIARLAFGTDHPQDNLSENPETKES